MSMTLTRLPDDQIVSIATYLDIPEAMRLKGTCRATCHLVTLPIVLAEQNREMTITNTTALLQNQQFFFYRAGIDTTWCNKLRPNFCQILSQAGHIIDPEQQFFKVIDTTRKISLHLNGSGTLAHDQNIFRYLPRQVIDRKRQIFIKSSDGTTAIVLFRNVVVLSASETYAPFPFMRTYHYPSMLAYPTSEKLEKIFYLNLQWTQFVVEVRSSFPSDLRNLIVEYATDAAT